MIVKSWFFIVPLVIIGLLVANPSSAANKQSEQAGWALGIEQRTVETSWYNYLPASSTQPRYTYETVNLLGVRGEYRAPFKQMETVSLDYGFAGSLFFIGDYTGERGSGSYSGDASAVSVDAFMQANFAVGSGVSLVGRAGPALTVINATAASSSAAAPYNEDFAITITEIYGAIGLKFDEFKFMGASSASLFYRFNLVDMGVSTDYYIYADPELESYSSSGLIFQVQF